MRTFSGAHVSPGSKEGPSDLDLALGLSRTPRWSGQGTLWFSVLDHTLYAVNLAIHAGMKARSVLAIALHDGHEAITGDIPTMWKARTQRAMQAQLDGEIMLGRFPGALAGYDAHKPVVATFDRRALLAEAYRLGPPYYSTPTADRDARFHAAFGGYPTQVDLAVLTAGIAFKQLSQPNELVNGVKNAQIQLYLNVLDALRIAAKEPLAPVDRPQNVGLWSVGY